MTKIAPRSHLWRRLCAAAWLSCLSLVTTDVAYGQTPRPCERAVLTLIEAADLLRIDADELERLARRKQVPARQIGSSWRFNCDALMIWLSPSPLPSQNVADVTATGTAIGQAKPTSSPDALAPVSGQDKPVGEPPEERQAEDIFLRGQRVLLGRGEVVVDFGQFYSRSDDDMLVSVDGVVGLARVEQRTFTTVLVARLGVLKETELFASTTFHSQDSHQFLGNTILGRNGRSEFGDMNIGVRRTLLREGVGRPDIIVSLDGHIPTGDTSYAVGGGLILVKSIDPVVLFANANYLHAFERDSSNGTRVRPENRVDVSMGYGLALNDTLAISAAVSGVFTATTTTTLDGARLRQPSNFSGRFGLTSWLAKGLYIEPSVSFGLTGPGDRFAFGVTVPYAF